jgi:5-formyltetrahydrofolate cyclo-ligase
MTKLKPAELEFWRNYRGAKPRDEVSNDAAISASIAGDDRNADELLQLYLNGKKTAASSLLIGYENAGEPLPQVGDFWIILNSGGVPKCIVKTIRVEIHRFDRVPESVATAEGEGDLSLAYWTKAHREFFQPYLQRLNVEDLSQERVITEFYDVVWTSKP